MIDNDNGKYIFYFIGLIIVVWISILIAPSIKNGISQLIVDFPNIVDNPFNLKWADDSFKVIVIDVSIYSFGILLYLSNDKNYRRREEHGSAKWGNKRKIRKKYLQESNKILTQKLYKGYKANALE